MKTKTREQIVELARLRGGIRPHDLKQELGISLEAIHRHLAQLVRDGRLEKRGKPPHVVYQVHAPRKQASLVGLSPAEQEILQHHYCYFTPTGEELTGVAGFREFLHRTQQTKDMLARAKEYIMIRDEAEKNRTPPGAQASSGIPGLIDGTKKLRATFPPCFLERLYYSDFYALPKYGKTKLGQYLLHGKSGQNLPLIGALAAATQSAIEAVIQHHQIEAIAYVPHSIPRKIPFLREYRAMLRLALPEIALIKVYSGDVPIAQKSLSKLSERIENARETIFPKTSQIPYGNILLIDDALGSGATLNEIAQKLKHANPTGISRKIYGYAIVGSYKGFDVLAEV